MFSFNRRLHMHMCNGACKVNLVSVFDIEHRIVKLLTFSLNYMAVTTNFWTINYMSIYLISYYIVFIVLLCCV